MKRIDADLSQPSLLPKGCAVTFGCFDGIHLGHQKIISKLKEEALKRKLKTALYLFHPHPQTVLNPKRNFKKLFTLEETQTLLQPWELDYFGVIPFNQNISTWSPEKFVTSFVVPHLKPKLIVAGYDFSFGASREGGISHLKSMGANWNFEVQQVSSLLKKKKPVSTSRIKTLLSQGHIEEANSLLWREFFLSGTVSRGEGRGRKLGYPTANLLLPDKVIPKKGVYSVQALVHEKWRLGVLNIGFKPTFTQQSLKKPTHGQTLSFEVHIINGEFDLYGKTLCVKMNRFLREEKTFKTAMALKTQIQKDIKEALKTHNLAKETKNLKNPKF